MRAVFFGDRNKENSEDIKNRLPSSLEVYFIAQPLGKETAYLAAQAEIISMFSESRADKAVLDKLPKLKLIAASTTGYDNIDLEYAHSKNITVTNVPAYGSQTVAEFAFGLILAVARKIVWGDKFFEQTLRPNMSQLEGFDLAGKTLGIIGTGRIGANVIKYAKAFDMKILAYDAHENENLARKLDFNYTGLDELLCQADVITLHVNLSPTTRHLINKQNISQIKRGSILINTSRGEVIESQALIEALESGILSGVGLDVLEEEKMLAGDKNDEIIEIDKKLIQMPNVVVTAHMAYNSREARSRILETNTDNIKKFLEGNIQNAV